MDCFLPEQQKEPIKVICSASGACINEMAAKSFNFGAKYEAGYETAAQAMAAHAMSSQGANGREPIEPDTDTMNVDSAPTGVAAPPSTPRRPLPGRITFGIGVRSTVANPIAGSGSIKAKRQLEDYHGHGSIFDSKVAKRTTAATKRAKHMKIAAQLKGSIDTPPRICYDVKGQDDRPGTELAYTCPSKTNDGEEYTVRIKTQGGKTRFTCTCQHMEGVYDETQNACSHVRATVMKIMMDLTQKQTNSVNMDDLSGILGGIQV